MGGGDSIFLFYLFQKGKIKGQTNQIIKIKIIKASIAYFFQAFLIIRTETYKKAQKRISKIKNTIKIKPILQMQEREEVEIYIKQNIS